jgi:hypothetical protein
MFEFVRGGGGLMVFPRQIQIATITREAAAPECALGAADSLRREFVSLERRRHIHVSFPIRA